jgi:hypothetical protein
MRLTIGFLLVYGGTLIASNAWSEEKKAPPPPAKPNVYYASDEDLKDKVRLSDEMAAKLQEIVRRKPKPFVRTLRVLPDGYFIIDNKTYAFYGFIATDPAKGDMWDDPVLRKFWEELMRDKSKPEAMKGFKP